MTNASPETVLAFWFGEEATPHWFARSADFDEMVRSTLFALYERAVDDDFESWSESAEGSLALCILFDQVPRNVFRGTPQAFETDAAARAIAFAALDRSFDRDLAPEHRLFFYLPLMHHEDVASQRRCLSLVVERVGMPEAVGAARRHLEIIERFGRFPHRNAILGRKSTPEEIVFLDEPNSSF